MLVETQGIVVVVHVVRGRPDVTANPLAGIRLQAVDCPCSGDGFGYGDSCRQATGIVTPRASLPAGSLSDATRASPPAA